MHLNVHKKLNIFKPKGFQYLIAVLLLATLNGFAQTDSLVLSYDEYLENILLFHPLAKKADLKQDFAEAELMRARGGLDPQIMADWSEKNFDDKLYYRKYQAKLVFPTSLGIDVVGGYENTEGKYINPENTTDEYGLWNLGVEVNVLSGLLTNERNTAIRQAKVYQNLAKNEQDILLNDLIYDALYAYYTWQMYQSFMEVLIENISIANTYYLNTKQSFLHGEKTAMDTLEAFISYQESQSLFNKNELALIKAKQMVENYLWFNDAPVALQPKVKPEHYRHFFLTDKANVDSVQIDNHPNVLASVNKLSIYEIEQRLKREKFKPKLKIKYNPLLTTSDDANIHQFDVANYKLGFNFSMPITFRTERAEIKKGKLKIREIELDIETKKNELLNKVEASWAQQALLKTQIDLLYNNVKNYRHLLDGENEKYRYGESSVFLLNKRQEKYIDGQLKLTEACTKHQLEMLNFMYYSNLLIPR